MRFALQAARERGMWVILYDEGMYPSGSASGQVVARDASFQTRGLTCESEAKVSSLNDDLNRILVAEISRANGERLAIFEQKIDSVVRGLHYIGEDDGSLGEEEPAAADLLNPLAVGCFLEIVYDRFYTELGEFFGNTVKAIFTDEPHPLSRSRNPNARPGGKATLHWVSKYLGYDFTPHLASLWFDDEPRAQQYRRAYAEAIAARLDETYFQPLSAWCFRHGIALTGHPAEPDDFGNLRHLHMPGQDIVWRHVEPDKPSALEGAPSTMAKAAASMAFHLGRERNLNEFAGAFGENLTFGELQWLASWLLIRGCDLLVPHAFYYSLRGPRRHERPPDVGPHSQWWSNYLSWADETRRLCWLNATFAPVCEVAILGGPTKLPWEAAKALFENQIDFHYVEPADLDGAIVDDGALCIGPGRYRCLVVENGTTFKPSHVFPVVRWSEQALDEIRQYITPCLRLDHPAPSLRVRRLRRESAEVILIFNEEKETVSRIVDFPFPGTTITRLDLSGQGTLPWSANGELTLPGHAWSIFLITPEAGD